MVRICIYGTHTHTVRSLICWHIDIKATNCRSKRDNKFLSNNNYNVSTKWISTNHIKVLIDRQPLRPFHFLTKNSSPFCFFDYYLLLLYIYITISNIFTNYISETILLFSPLLWICDCIRTSSLDKVQMCEIYNSIFYNPNANILNIDFLLEVGLFDFTHDEFI